MCGTLLERGKADLEWLKKVRGVRYCVPLVHFPCRRKCQGSPRRQMPRRAGAGASLRRCAAPLQPPVSGLPRFRWAAPGRFERLRPAVLRFPGRSAPPALLFRFWAAAPPRACRAFDLFAILPPRVLPFRSSSPSLSSLARFSSAPAPLLVLVLLLGLARVARARRCRLRIGSGRWCSLRRSADSIGSSGSLRLRHFAQNSTPKIYTILWLARQ